MRTLLAVCCLLVASLVLGERPVRAQFRLSPPGGDSFRRSRFRTDEPPPTVSELLLNELLQWELKLSDEQIDQLEGAEAAVKQRHEEEANRLSQLLRENMEAVRALAQKIEREQREVMRNVLTPAQRERVRQVEIQLAGPSAFNDPDVQQALQLTEAQKEALEKALTDVRNSYMEESRRNRRAGAPGVAGAAPVRADLDKRLQEFSQQALKTLEAQLTAEQKKRWATLVGGPCAAVEKWQRNPFTRLALLRPPSRRGRGPITTLGPSEITAQLRDELKLSEEQATRIDKLPGVIFEGHKEESKQLRKQAKEQEQAQAALEGRQTAEMAKAMTAVLKPEQRRRLEQLQLQMLGLAAWDDPAVQKALKLTADQQTALKKVRDEARANAEGMMTKAREEASRESRGDFERRRRLQERKAAAAYRAVAERMVALLTPEQQKQWRELTGPPIRLRVEFAPPDR
jgi:hypothetical protein